MHSLFNLYLSVARHLLMYRILSFLLLFTTLHSQLNAQIFPKEGRVLNYRIIGFSFPSVPEVNNYTIVVALGNHSTEESFKKSIVLSISCDTNRKILTVPSFGKQYTWRVEYTVRNLTKITKTGFHHFSTGIVPAVDTSINKLKIITVAQKYKDAFVFLDVPGVLFDMNGEPVWYLPNNINFDSTNIRDIKLSPLGTITYMDNNGIYEIDYDGNLLWTKPEHSINNNSTHKTLDYMNNRYHHQFNRLPNGHYMALGFENVSCKLPDSNDSVFAIIDDEIMKKNTDSTSRKELFGTLVEYDQKGNLVWRWRSSKYFEKSDLLNWRIPNARIDLHDNAFFFDENNNTFYISFRNISRIIKLKYPEGDVLNTYGNIYQKGAPNKHIYKESGNEFFAMQHACSVSQNGHLCMYNNGSGDSNVIPTVLVMQEPLSEKGKLKKVWEFECSINDSEKRLGFLPGAGGGNVLELADQSMFVAMGKSFSKIFIVNLDKQILWSAMFEIWDKDQKTWKMLSSYKASIITNLKELEQLIWNAENK